MAGSVACRSTGPALNSTTRRPWDPQRPWTTSSTVAAWADTGRTPSRWAKVDHPVAEGHQEQVVRPRHGDAPSGGRGTARRGQREGIGAAALGLGQPEVGGLGAGWADAVGCGRLVEGVGGAMATAATVTSRAVTAMTTAMAIAMW